MRLRAHHLLCILGFRGLGYDEKFIKEMKRIIQKIKENSDLKIKLIEECDNICAVCPFNIDGLCENEAVGGEERVGERDKQVAGRLDLKAGDILTAKEVMDLLKKKIKPDDLSVICKDCPWLKMEYCAEGLKKIDDFLGGKR
ncbi:DUF1284 domain-containing protein [bacterium]|nr:DUF1284 domain-containing protein [bacterium]MBU4561603.1 DUF1284 domain-containing protein [bacterium]MCG2676425.1 DUF1284 domain-containing protein [bacterium]MCG2677784.1 DUF1284 domain-containing protein [bacterium]